MERVEPFYTLIYSMKFIELLWRMLRTKNKYLYNKKQLSNKQKKSALKTFSENAM